MSNETVRLVGYSADERWVSALGLRVVQTAADLTIWRPVGQRPAGRAIAFLDVNEDDHGVIHPDALSASATFADAYAGDESGLRSAIAWLRDPAPFDRGTLTYLGGLGVRSPFAVGKRFVLDSPALVGRATGADIGLRTGAHSDQNMCARHHARLSFAAGGLLVEDLGSTNGTYVDGLPILRPTLVAPGQEIGFAGCFRFRVG